MLEKSIGPRKEASTERFENKNIHVVCTMRIQFFEIKYFLLLSRPSNRALVSPDF